MKIIEMLGTQVHSNTDTTCTTYTVHTTFNRLHNIHTNYEHTDIHDTYMHPLSSTLHTQTQTHNS